MRKGMELLGNGLRALPKALEEMGTGRLARGIELKAEDSFTKVLGVPDKGTKEERWAKVQDTVSRLATEPEHRIEKVAQVASVQGMHPDAVAAYNARIQAGIDYVFSALPKDPNAEKGMFTPRAPWMPSEAEMARFGRRLQVVADPFSVVNELKNGTLTKDHVEALEAMYPQLLQEMRSQVARLAGSPTRPTLTTAQRSQVAVLMGGPTERGKEPRSVAQYQSVYASGQDRQATTPVGKPIKLKGMPSMASDSQRLQGRRSA